MPVLPKRQLHQGRDDVLRSGPAQGGRAGRAAGEASDGRGVGLPCASFRALLSLGRPGVPRLTTDVRCFLTSQHGATEGSLLHEGSAVFPNEIEGAKYVIRTEILYEVERLAGAGEGGVVGGLV